VRRSPSADALPEDEITLNEDRVEGLRLLTVEVKRDREKVADLLAAAGAILLDAQHALVGSSVRPRGPTRRPRPEGQHASPTENLDGDANTF
jgi:hypothetical protein